MWYEDHQFPAFQQTVLSEKLGLLAGAGRPLLEFEWSQVHDYELVEAIPVAKDRQPGRLV